MLLQFNFKNYKSFKDQVSLDMTATSIQEHPYNLLENTKGETYLKVASIYGANASGKSNPVNAFRFIRVFVLDSLAKTNQVSSIPVETVSI